MYVIEFRASGTQYWSERSPVLAADTAFGDATASWAEAVSAAEVADVSAFDGNPTIVVTNSGTDAIRVAMSSDADPAQWSVVLGGSQRMFGLVNGKPVKVRTL